MVNHFHWWTCIWTGGCEQTASRQQGAGRKGKTQPQQTASRQQGAGRKGKTQPQQTASRQQGAGRKGKTQPQQTVSLSVVKIIRSPVNRPDPIQKRFSYGHLWPLRPSCSPNRDGLVRCWPNASGSEASQCAGIIGPAISFPVSDSVAFFHRRPGSYCAKPTWVRFGSG